MAGTVAGGRKAYESLRARLGDDYMEYRREMGRKGGLKSQGGGFARDPELARSAGSKGGKTSRRPKSKA